MVSFTPSEADIDAFRRDGCICLRGVFTDWIEIIAAGIERNIADPGPMVSPNLDTEGSGRFFDDYCN